MRGGDERCVWRNVLEMGQGDEVKEREGERGRERDRDREREEMDRNS